MPFVFVDGKAHAVTPLVDVGGTDPVEIIRCTPAGLKYVIRKLFIYNRDTADHEVTLGEYDVSSGSWVRDVLVVKVAAGQMLSLTPDDLPMDFVVTVDQHNALRAWAAKLDADVSANPVKVKAEFAVV